MNPTAQQQSLLHSTFNIKRTYPSSPARVFAAFANPETKRRWFVEVEGFEIDEFSMDFRVGGRELSRFRFQGGEAVSNEGIYLDILLDQRIVNLVQPLEFPRTYAKSIIATENTEGTEP